MKRNQTPVPEGLAMFALRLFKTSGALDEGSKELKEI